MKIKYYQLAFKDGECKKLVSPGRNEIESLEADGWMLHGFDNEADIPANPILDNSEVREMTADETATELLTKKLAQNIFDRMDILNTLETADKTALLTALASNAEFSAFWSASKNGVDLTNSVCVAALSALGWNEAKTNALKLKILG